MAGFNLGFVELAAEQAVRARFDPAAYQDMLGRLGPAVINEERWAAQLEPVQGALRRRQDIWNARMVAHEGNRPRVKPAARPIQRGGKLSTGEKVGIAVGSILAASAGMAFSFRAEQEALQFEERDAAMRQKFGMPSGKVWREPLNERGVMYESDDPLPVLQRERAMTELYPEGTLSMSTGDRLAG